MKNISITVLIYLCQLDADFLYFCAFVFEFLLIVCSGWSLIPRWNRPLCFRLLSLISALHFYEFLMKTFFLIFQDVVVIILQYLKMRIILTAKINQDHCTINILLFWWKMNQSHIGRTEL